MAAYLSRQSGWGRFQMPLKLALLVRETVAGHRLGTLEGVGGWVTPFQGIPVGGGASAYQTQTGRLPSCTCLHFPCALPQIRRYKSEADIAMFQRAADISKCCFEQAFRATRPGLSEHHIFNVMEFEARLHGAQRLAYPPVIAGGANGLSLHYVKNSQVLRDGDLLLVVCLRSLWCGCAHVVPPPPLSKQRSRGGLRGGVK